MTVLVGGIEGCIDEIIRPLFQERVLPIICVKSLKLGTTAGTTNIGLDVSTIPACPGVSIHHYEHVCRF